MDYLTLRQEFQDALWFKLSPEEKALKTDVKSGEYIDLVAYVTWLEKKLIEEREKNNEPILKRTK